MPKDVSEKRWQVAVWVLGTKIWQITHKPDIGCVDPLDFPHSAIAEIANNRAADFAIGLLLLSGPPAKRSHVEAVLPGLLDTVVDAVPGQWCHSKTPTAKGTWSALWADLDYVFRSWHDGQVTGKQNRDSKTKLPNTPSFDEQPLRGLESAAENDPILWRSILAARVTSLRENLLAAFNAYLRSVQGMTGTEMLSESKRIQSFCEENACVLRRIDENGQPIEGSEFTLRSGRLRPDREKESAMEAPLRSKMQDALTWEVIPSIEAISVTGLSATDQEIVFTRIRSRFLAKRTGGHNLSTSDRRAAGKRGGRSRASKLSHPQ